MIPGLCIWIEAPSLQLAPLPEASIFEEDIDHPEACQDETGESIPIALLKDEHSEKPPWCAEQHSQQRASNAMQVHFLARNACEEIHSLNVMVEIAE